MPKLWVTRGLPGSGKTTWARQRLDALRLGEVVRVNRDALRRMALPTDYGTPVPVAERLITIMHHAALRAVLTGGYDVICDDTNLPVVDVQALRDIATWAGADMAIVDFTGVPVEECVRRDAKRHGCEHVGERVIRDLHARHISKEGKARGDRHVP